jgi:Mg2+ and Co2+ transporter CorA
MQVYYFYQHPTEHHIFVQKEPIAQAEPEFIWIDYTRADVVNRAETWQKEIEQQTHLYLNELHVNDILNLEHPCVFDSMDDYELLIFRKLITPDDDIESGEQALEQHEKVFGLATTPISFIMTPQVLITVREQGNKAIKNYISRIETHVIRFPLRNKISHENSR